MVAVIGKTGTPLMPTSPYRARKLMSKGKAEIYKHMPFTIRLLDREDGDTQDIEYCCDTGYAHIGISIKSEKKEYVNAQYDLLTGEPERHNDRRKYRRARRNRKRYRKPRFDNRKKEKGWLAPSVRNKRDVHVELLKMYMEVMPVTKVIFEMGQLDTQVLKAMEKGEPLPEGKDYQMGEQYGYATLREAVFARDGYKCIVCGKGIKDGRILTAHHLGYGKGDKSNRMDNLATVCTDCHTSKNHQPGGKLYDLEPKLKGFKGATFMTMVRWDMIRKLKELDIEVHITYGALTKLARKELGLEKSHTNDAYCMGDFHPERAGFEHYRKRRRNNRILEKFYDARYIDIRDGKKKSGTQLSCNRTNRREPRMSPKNERIYRGEKVSRGRRAIRTCRYPVQPGDVIRYNGENHTSAGCHCKGSRVTFHTDKQNSVSVKKVTVVRHAGGWVITRKEAAG